MRMNIVRTDYTSGLGGFWLRRPLVLAALCFGTGILAGMFSGLPVWLFAAAAGVFAVGTAACAVFKRRAAGVLMAAILMLGAWQGAVCVHIPATPAEDQYAVTARITDIVRQESDRITLHADNVTLGGTRYPGSARIYLYADAAKLPDDMAIGATVRLIGKVWLPQGVRNPDGFDFRAYLARRGVYFCINAQLPGVELSAPDSLLMRRMLFNVREWVKSRVTTLFGADDGALVQAIMLGIKDEMPDELLLDFRQSGLSHLLAVSGLHISFLVVLLQRLLKRRFWPRQRLLFTALLMLVYCALTGFTPSIVRASIMGMVLAAASCAGRGYDGPSALSVALIIILAFNPGAIVEASFVLSFAAVLSLQLLTPCIRKLLPTLSLSQGVTNRLKDMRAGKSVVLALLRAPKSMLDMLAASMAVTLGMIPFMSLFFYQFSLSAILGNLIAIPLGMLLLPLGWACIALSALNMSVGFGAALIASIPAQLLTSWAAWLAKLPFSCVRLPMLSPFWLIIWLPIMAWCSNYRPLKPKLRKYGLVALIMVACVAVLIANVTMPGLTAIMLDVGQADSFVFSIGKSAVVVDVGKESSATVQYLLSHGINVESLFISHLHEDHAGSLKQVVNSLGVKTVYMPKNALKYADASVLITIDELMADGLELRELCAGDELSALNGELHIAILHPEANDSFKDSNDVSTIMTVEYAGRSFLMTGDATSKTDVADLPQCDVLKVAHHGSSNASSASELAAVSPILSLISVGANNGYGHPSAPTLARLEDSGTVIMRTDQCGAIAVRVSPTGDASVTPFLH